MEVLHMTATLCVVLYRHTDTKLLTEQNICVTVKKKYMEDILRRN